MDTTPCPTCGAPLVSITVRGSDGDQLLRWYDMVPGTEPWDTMRLHTTERCQIRNLARHAAIVPTSGRGRGA